MALFDTTVEAEETGTRAINGAAYVKQMSMVLANDIMSMIPGADDAFLTEIKDSQSSTAAMDDLVQKYCGEKLNNEQVAVLDEEDAKKILKSNQSSRSRRKNMAMTQSNYVELLVSAIAENMVRESCNMHKSANPFAGFRSETKVINEETVAEMMDDPDAIGRAIRNIQSKKSTFKAKHADEEYETSEDWQELLHQEALLKEARAKVGGNVRGGRKGVSLKKALQFIFDGVAETDALGKDESHEIIEACRGLANGKYPEAFLAMVEEQLADEVAAEMADAEGAVADAEAAEAADVYADTVENA